MYASYRQSVIFRLATVLFIVLVGLIDLMRQRVDEAHAQLRTQAPRAAARGSARVVRRRRRARAKPGEPYGRRTR